MWCVKCHFVIRILCHDNVPLIFLITGTLRAMTLIARENGEEAGAVVGLELLRDCDCDALRRVTSSRRIHGEHCERVRFVVLIFSAYSLFFR